MLKQLQKYYFVIFLAVIYVFLINQASAQTVDNAIDNIVITYADNAAAWEGALRGYAQSLFGMLVLLDFAWILIRLIIAKFDFTDFFGEIIRQLFFVGFFYLLLQHSTDWANAIVQSFRVAGDAASTAAGGEANLAPSDIYDSAITIAGTAFNSLQFFLVKPVESIAIAFSGIIIVISFALIAALEIVALVECYIVIYASIIFMGFGGSHFTSNFALKTLQYAVSVGAKLFTIQLIIGLGQRMMMEWSDELAAKGDAIQLMDIITIMGSSIVLLAVTKIIPEIVQGMLNGASLANGRSLVTSASAAGHMALAGAAGATALAAGTLGASGSPMARSISSWASDTAVGHGEEAFRDLGANSGRIHGYHAARAEQQRYGNEAMVSNWRSEGYESEHNKESPKDDSPSNDDKEEKQPNLIAPA